MRHFKTLSEAKKELIKKDPHVVKGLKIYKKRKGQPKKNTHPYIVGTYMEWLNWN